MNKKYLAFLITISFFAFSNLSIAQKKNKNPDHQATEEQMEVQTVNPAESEYVFSEGMKHYLLEEYAKALVKFQAALQSAPPRQAGIYFQIAYCYFHLNNLESGISNLKKAIEIDDKNIYYYLLMVRIYEQQVKKEDLIRTYQTLLAKIPSKKEYNYELGNAFFSIGKYSDALNAYNQLEQTFGITQAVIEKKQQVYIAKKEIDNAIAEGRKLIDSNPFDVGHRIALAQLMVENNRIQEATRLLDEITLEQSEDYRIDVAMASIYQYSGQTSKAFESVEKALNNPFMSIDWKIAMVRNFIDMAQTTAEKEMFVKNIERLLKENPNDRDLNAYYAERFLSKTDESASLPFYLNSVRIDPAQKEIWEKILVMELEKNLADSAITHAELALEVYPNYAGFWLYYGMAYTQKQKYDNALDALKEAQRLTFNNKVLLAAIHSQTGEVYFSMNNYSQAEIAYRTSVENNPEGMDALTLEHYGDVLFKINQVDKAMEQWKKSKAKGNTSPDLDKKIAGSKTPE